MNIPEKLLYTNEHEWISVDGEKGKIGITDYAQHHMGDIVFVELPEVDDEVELGGNMGVIESVKAVSTVFSPVAGTIVEVNEDLEDTPEVLNEQPYESWIAVVKLSDSSDLDELMNAEQYAAFCDSIEE